MTTSSRILVIEDDADTQANLRDILELDGYQADIASGVAAALRRSNWSEYTAIILDRRLPDGTAEDLLPRLVEFAPDAALVVVTGYADFEGTVTALRHGVSDYILKPINPEALRRSLQRIERVRKAEERAQQAERLAAVGEMMTVLTHESRNAFQLAGANLDMLSLLLEDNEEGRRLVERVRNHQAHVNRLFDDVRGYAAPIVLDLHECDITSVIENAADEVRVLHLSRWLRIDVSIHGVLDEADEPEFPLSHSERGRQPGADSAIGDNRAIRADPSTGAGGSAAALQTAGCQTTKRQETPLPLTIDSFRIEQVFRNLLENSLAAGSDPVQVTIECSVSNRVNGSRARCVRIDYRDNGPGLTLEGQRRLFEPFFTTESRGTGLGMAISRRIIEAHHGTIEIMTGQQEFPGAGFTIKLPA